MKKLSSSTARRNTRLGWRTDLICCWTSAAAVLADFVLQRSGAREIAACTWALREGMLLELAKATNRGAREIRRGSVNALAARFAHPNRHGRQVAKLALMLFDATALALELPESSRELLEYAALLHDIGHAID